MVLRVNKWYERDEFISLVVVLNSFASCAAIKKAYMLCNSFRAFI
jgi:hypothetical protein